MGEVVDITTKKSLKAPAKENVSLVKFIEDNLEKDNSIEALMIGIKYENDEIEMFRTDNFDLKDRSFILQLIQADINEELSSTVQIELEPDM